MASVVTTNRSRPSADPALEELLAPILESFALLRPGEDDTTIVEAARAAELAHRGQVRRSGEDYVTHPVAVAQTVAELGLDAATVAAAYRMLKQRGFWVEIVTLVVPGFSDDVEDLKRMAGFLASVDPLMPWHVTAFHPDYKMTDGFRRTTAEDLMRIVDLLLGTSP